jgi:hypothetical protein
MIVVVRFAPKRDRETAGGARVMFCISKNDEIAVRVQDEELDVPALAAIAQYPDLEVFAMRSYCDREGVVLLLVTNNPSKTTCLLERVGYQCRRQPVVLVGPLARRGWACPLQAELEASGIQVHYSYAHRNERGHLYLAFKTEEDDRALRVLSATLHGVASDLADRSGAMPEELQQIAA